LSTLRTLSIIVNTVNICSHNTIQDRVAKAVHIQHTLMYYKLRILITVFKVFNTHKTKHKILS